MRHEWLTCSMLTMGTEGDLAHAPGLTPASLLTTRGVWGVATRREAFTLACPACSSSSSPAGRANLMSCHAGNACSCLNRAKGQSNSYRTCHHTAWDIPNICSHTFEQALHAASTKL